MIKAPDERPVGSSGLAHTALEIEGAGEQLRELYGRLKRFGARVEFTTDHVLTKSVYFFDPGGNRLEIFSQELSSASAKQCLHEAQAAADVMRPAGSRDGDFHRPAFELKVGSRAGESCRAGCIGLRVFPSSFGHQSQTANAL